MAGRPLTPDGETEERAETSPASVTERAADQGAALVEGVGRRRPNEDS